MSFALTNALMRRVDSVDGDHIHAIIAKSFERSAFLRCRPVEATVLETASIVLDIVRTDLRLDDPAFTLCSAALQQWT